VPEDNTYEYPEQLLAGADRPRPLPAGLRARLEEALGTAGTGPSVRPLSAEVRGKLETSLRPGQTDETDETDATEGPERPEKPEKDWRAWAPRLTVAAAVIIALAIFVPTLSHAPGSHGPGPSALHAAAGPLTTRSGLSAITAPPTGPATGSPANAGAASRAARAPTAPAAMVPPRGATTGAPASTTAPATNGPAANLGPDKSSFGPPQAAFVAPAPVVAGVSPHGGPVGGGNWVMVHGTNLLGARAVYFGRVRAAGVDVLSVSQLKALAPAHASGTVDVVVAGPSGRSQVSPADRYSFAP
jgi:hypothetical protein